jgi:hypothetical protein
MPPQQTTGTTPMFTANYHLRASDFPFTKFTDQTDRTSGIISDTQAIASSQGVFNSKFVDITPASCPTDQPFLGTICDKVNVDPTGNGTIFNPTASPLTQVRNVEPRNTPTNIRRHTHEIPYTVGLVITRSPPERAARTHGTAFPWVRIASIAG